MFSSLIGGGEAARPAALTIEQKLARLERAADGAMPGYEAHFFNKAGDICLAEDTSMRALGYYGRAIDAYLKEGHYDAAGAVCRKLVRIAPCAVRARCTLTWLLLGKRCYVDARRQLESYLDAARLSDKVELARRQLEMMGGVVGDRETLEAIGWALLDMGADTVADQVFGRAMGAASEGAARMGADEVAEQWEQVVQAALMGPRELEEGDVPDDLSPRTSWTAPGTRTTSEPTPEPPAAAAESTAVDLGEDGQGDRTGAGSGEAETESAASYAFSVGGSWEDTLY